MPRFQELSDLVQVVVSFVNGGGVVIINDMVMGL